MKIWEKYNKGNTEERFESLGGYRLETDAKTILSGLGFRGGGFRAPAPGAFRGVLDAGLPGPPPSPSVISPETTLDAPGQKAFDHD